MDRKLDAGIFCLLAAALLFAGECFAGPFGTNMDDPLEKYYSLKDSDFVALSRSRGEGIYLTPNVPEPEDCFQNYTLTFCDDKLAAVSGNTATYSRQEIRLLYGMYDDIVNKISSVYGEYNCSRPQIDKNGIQKLACYWKNYEPDNISRIDVVLGEDVTGGFQITATFEYSNYDIFHRYNKR